MKTSREEIRKLRSLGVKRVETGEDIRLNMLVYGFTGVGKTPFIGSAQECEYTSPIFFIAADPGTLSISGTNIEVVRPQSFKQIQEIYNYLRHENTRYRSVGIDSLTEIHDKLAMGEIIGVLDTEDSSYKNLESHVPSTQYDWLQSGEQMKRFIRAFRDLAYLPDPEKRIHVFMSALERADEKRNVVCPALPGALGLSVGASIDILARMSVKRVIRDKQPKKVRRMLLEEGETEDGLRILAKVRAPEGIEFPGTLRRPKVADILSYWVGSKKGEDNE